MKYLALAVALLVTPAAAADISLLKAAPKVAAYPTTACGMYLGIIGEGDAAVVNGAPAGTVSTGGNIGGTFGYACPVATFPWFIEAIASWQNLGTANGPFTLNAPFHGEVRAGVQNDLLQLIPQFLPGTGAITLPSPTLPVLPPGASQNGSTVSYFYGAANFDDASSQFGLASFRGWLFSPEIGAGILDPIKLANGKPVVIDTWIGAELQTNSYCLGQFTCPKLGTRWKVGGAIKF